ncbi:MAG TPA: hypothetical protein VGN74_01585 [Brevundimonas sp.]|jgi:hypothetical protein|uniref:P-loop ATPase, Sll1717 family n=1 Tax=Brevundimonas sp. TaxID=1871086 RepID=UPI002E0E8AC1|nr:hypothetical protein [Brevundimonas sp.]
MNPSVKELLKDLSFGGSVAEFDAHLKDYFLETHAFRELITDRKDIVAGDKGTGKTAIFKVLHERYPYIQELSHVVVVPAFNTSGDPIFQEIATRSPQEEGEYIMFWKGFILALVGNWLLKHNRYDKKSPLNDLDNLLRGLGLRSELDQPRPVFDRIMAKAAGVFSWQAAELKFGAGAEGISLTPRVEFDKRTKADARIIPVAGALALLNKCLAETGKVAWVAIDRMDEAFQGYPDVEIPALRALFRTYLDFAEFNRIKLKLFVRQDLFRRIVSETFVNLSHINDRKVDVIWDEEDLMSLLVRRVRQGKIFAARSNISKLDDKDVFYSVFPDKIDAGKRQPETWTWMMGRIKDGNGVKPPRNLIDLATFARDAQLRKEEREREPRPFVEGKAMIEAEAVRKALGVLSDRRVNDTLLAEARSLAPCVRKFKNSRSEHNEGSISDVLGEDISSTRTKIEQLRELGFLEEVGSSYKIPMLYRGGLNITQGKAF